MSNSAVIPRSRQCAAARTMLGWHQTMLAERAGLSAKALSFFETGKTSARDSTLTAVEEAFKNAGVLLRDDGGIGLQPSVQIPRGRQYAAARVLLGWSREELSERTNVSAKAIALFEQGKSTPRGASLDAFDAAFYLEGVTLPENGEILVEAQEEPLEASA
ncbi:helix-turn-helix protein [Pseudomonas duriflava]|uniref:Helix-turn-helix protein n=1 Tax=Pseudomonas duriflava TaxID=459528 RepID=A0A562PS07_9PSED|nr:helix-turn-helix transcriptional regulator [Pseudomonas duriflava]TWI46856.1 helix-turn-helix protein [Pseudomonas duriflava]